MIVSVNLFSKGAILENAQLGKFKPINVLCG